MNDSTAKHDAYKAIDDEYDDILGYLLGSRQHPELLEDLKSDTKTQPSSYEASMGAFKAALLRSKLAVTEQTGISGQEGTVSGGTTRGTSKDVQQVLSRLGVGARKDATIRIIKEITDELAGLQHLLEHRTIDPSRSTRGIFDLPGFEGPRYVAITGETGLSGIPGNLSLTYEILTPEEWSSRRDEYRGLYVRG